MCTVSFVPISNNEFVFTSNRDESPIRDTLAPKVYEKDDAKLVYPKDVKAGGTWIGVSDKKRLICLLNGGFEAHIPKRNYRLSRGVVVKNLLTVNDFLMEIENIDLLDIEPFTIIIVDYLNDLKLYELVWDGMNKFFNSKKNEPTIWSSSLLYSKEIKIKREDWFNKYLKENPDLSPDKLLYFHKNAGEGDEKTNLIMNRGFVCTKSITQFQKINNFEIMKYEDLQNQSIIEISL